MKRLLTGTVENHLCSAGDAKRLGTRVHADVVTPFRALATDARAAGFDLRILSGFRSFEHQLSIWNRKAEGQLPVLDSNASPIQIQDLSATDLMFAILRWSALPGASRHHWGTDLDVYDAAAQPEGYEIELIPEEVDPGGMFGPLHDWLDERIANDTSHGFFRPYDVDRQGVAPERWHLSYAPVSAALLEALTPDILGQVVLSADMKLKDTVHDHVEEIHARFVSNVAPVPFGRPFPTG